MPSKLWRKSLGERGLRVYLFERTPGGTLYREVYVGGKRVPKKSLRHKDKERAEADGYTLLAKLKTREEALQGGKLRLSALFDIYVVSAAHNAKKARTRREDEARLDRVITFVGKDRDVRSLSASDVERYRQARVSGKYGPSRKPVGPRAVAADFVALNTMLNWATAERDSRGSPLVESNPLRGVKLPVEKNPKRPIESYDRYLQLMEVAAEVDWRLPAALALAEATGQRIGAILQLRREDVDLLSAPFGRVSFRSETQKMGVALSVPLSEEASEVLKEHFCRLTTCDSVVFSSRRKPGVPMTVSVMGKLLREAYSSAGLDTLPGGLWHPWRRKWATERKEMPLKDVAAAGGWKDWTTLVECYQQPDEGTLAKVVLEAPKLRSEPEVTPNATPPAEAQRYAPRLHLKVV